MGDITKIRYEDLNNARTNIIGSQTEGNYNLIARQTAYGGERTTALNLRTNQIGARTFEFGGRGYSETIVYDYWTGQPITSTTKLIAGGRGTTATWFAQSNNAIATIPDIQASYGIGMSGERTITTFLGKTTQQQPSINLFGWGGFARSSDDIISIASGQISKDTGLTLSTSSRGFIINIPSDVGSSVGGSFGTTLKNVFPSGAIEQITKSTTPSFSSTSTTIPRTIFDTSGLTKTTQNFKPFTATSSINIDTTEYKSIAIPKVDTQQIVKQNTKGLTIPTTITSTISTSRTNQIPLAIPTTAQIPKIPTKQILATPTAIAPVTPPTINLPPKTYTPPFFLIPPLIPEFNFKQTTRIYRGRQRKKYTPSYEALAFNIRGKAPKGIETGFRTRPIPKGYSFAFKMPKFKFKMPKFKF